MVLSLGFFGSFFYFLVFGFWFRFGFRFSFGFGFDSILGFLCRAEFQLGGGFFGVGLSSRDRGNFSDGNFGGGNFNIYIWFGKWNRWFRVGLSSRDRGNIVALSWFPTNKPRGLRR